ncbi:hypothetical protein ACIBL3_04985 [Kribbella sp. NPDC050124]|uniref:hypothetical protein n=1 Tax=Kribbella sp. NPDC050124 TaxID=3364114 RepID=UPI003789B17C
MLFGLSGAVATGLSLKTGGASWAETGGFAALGGVMLAIGMWWAEPRWRRERAEVEGDLPSEKLELARRAAQRGPVPSDPEVRAAALRIASYDLDSSTWVPGPRIRTAIGAVMAINAVGAARSGSLWALIFAFSAALMLWFGLYYPRQLRRRIELLSQPPLPTNAGNDSTPEKPTA